MTLKSIVLRVKDFATKNYIRVLFNTPKEARTYANRYLTVNEDNNVYIECYFRGTSLTKPNTLIFTIERDNICVYYKFYKLLAKRRVTRIRPRTIRRAA